TQPYPDIHFLKKARYWFHRLKPLYHLPDLPLFFQAEDGIRCRNVTGVQTCALPIFSILGPGVTRSENAELRELRMRNKLLEQEEIGRASCREREKIDTVVIE